MDIMSLLYLIPLVPLAGFLLNGLLRNYLPKGVASFIGSVAVLISFGLSLMVLNIVSEDGFQAFEINYFNFLHAGNIVIDFGFKIDQLTSIFLLIITGVGFLIHVYSSAYMHDESRSGFAKFFAYLNLFIFSMLLLVMGNNFLIMFIGWEGVGLCSYLLIGFWYRDHENNKAANKAFVMNRIGDVGFLLAMFWMLAGYHTLSYTQLFDGENALMLTQPIGSTFVVGVSLLLLLGATGKSAQIPLYTWLPDAMAGPTPVSALIHAATMVTAGIYMIARSNILYALAPFTLSLISIIGIATAILAALIALKQNDIKKVLAYSTVSQLGYMFLALGVGAFSAGVFHVMTHAFFKALLFLGAGSVIHAIGGQQDIMQMGGLSKKMKITFMTFLIACIAIAGIPPFSGFFSKDEILLAVFLKSPLLYVTGLAGAVLTAIYMFRLLALTFGGSYRGVYAENKIHESPGTMTIPLIILAILSIVGGWVGIPEVINAGSNYFGDFLNPVFSKSQALLPHAHVSHRTEWILMSVSALLMMIAAIASWMYYKKGRSGVVTGRLALAMKNKFYVDEIYAAIIVRPLMRIASFFENLLDSRVIDGFVNGIGKGVGYGSRQLRLLQSGQVGSYILLMVLGVLLLFVVQMLMR